MLRNKCFVLAGSIFILANLGLAESAPAQGEVDAKPPTETWPPEWLQGAWKNETTVVTSGGLPSNRNFFVASYYIFISGHRFSIYEGRRIRATPMLGQTQRGEALHCLFKMTETRPAMQAKFTKHAEKVQYVSYLISSITVERIKFQRQLSRAPINEKLIEIVKTTFEKEFASPDSETAQTMLENWIREQERLAADN